MNVYTSAGELRAPLGQHPLDNQPRFRIGYTYFGGGGAERGGQEEDRSGEYFFIFNIFQSSYPLIMYCTNCRTMYCTNHRTMYYTNQWLSLSVSQ